ncbi:twin-arginine translocation signal domain-containing protein, partial [Meiothermus sp. PNK-Is4]
MSKLNRRQLLKAGAALTAASALGNGAKAQQEFYATPPTLLPARRTARVVVVGGGWA